MAFIRTEEEVDKLIEEMMNKGKGNYITQSVVFNKKNSRHVELLKKTLMSSESFGGFVKEVLLEKFSVDNQENGKTYILIDSRNKDKNTDYFMEV